MQSCMPGGLNVQDARTTSGPRRHSASTASSARPDKDPRRRLRPLRGHELWPPNHSTVVPPATTRPDLDGVLFSDRRIRPAKLYNVADDYVSRRWGQRNQCLPTAICR